MLHDCVEYQGFTQLNARIDAINASIYAVSRVFVACFWHVSALRAKLLYMCIAKSAHMVEMHHILLICVKRFSRFPLVRRFHVFTFLPVNLINAFHAQALGLPGREPARMARVSAYRVN